MKLLRIAAHVVEGRGHVNASEIGTLRTEGYDDEEIVEITAVIALNFFLNHFDLITQIGVDFPPVKLTEPLRKSAAQ